MANFNLNGYGPHVLAASNDYYIQAVNGNAKGRREQLTIGIQISAGNILVVSRERGSGAALEAQSYKKADETLAAAAIAAGATVRVDATSKDIVLRTAALTVATVELGLDSDM